MAYLSNVFFNKHKETKKRAISLSPPQIILISGNCSITEIEGQPSKWISFDQIHQEQSNYFNQKLSDLMAQYRDKLLAIGAEPQHKLQFFTQFSNDTISASALSQVSCHVTQFLFEFFFMLFVKMRFPRSNSGSLTLF